MEEMSDKEKCDTKMAILYQLRLILANKEKLEFI